MKEKQLADILGKPMTREEVMDMLRRDGETYESFCSLSNKEFREELISFFMGESGVQVTYDRVFRHIMNPSLYPERLSSLLGCIIGQPLKVKRVLPRDSNRINEKGSLLIMDILVELETGELANVEMQRIGYYFPGQRAACYASDLLMRQYSDLRDREGDAFDYKHLKTVYCIILIGESGREFRRIPGSYRHRAQMAFDTGVQLDMLQKFFFIPLDIFRKITHNQGIGSELEAWLHFLTSTDGATIRKVVEAYPWFAGLYHDLAHFRDNGREMIEMYSDALKIMDYNTVQYMIEDQKKQLEENRAQLEENRAQLEEDGRIIEEKDEEIERLRAELAELKKGKV